MDADERLVVMLEARVTEFEKRMRQAERRGTSTYQGLQNGSGKATRQMEADMARSSRGINQSLASVSGNLGAFGKAFAASALATGLAMMTRQASATVREIAQIGDEAKRAGVAVEAFQEWGYVARQNRIDIGALTDGFKELNLRADEFVITGKGSAAEAFNRLGYSAADLKEKLKDPSELMLEIMGRLEGLDKAAQIRIADELFGGTGGERFVELLSQGEAGIRKTMEEARKTGVVMDSDMIAKAQELDAKFTEVADRMRGIWRAGVVEAALYFGFVEREREKLKFVPEDSARVVGADLTEELGKLPEVGQAALAVIESLHAEYDDLGVAASVVASQLNDGAMMLRGLGKEAEAVTLTQLAQRLSEAAAEFDRGNISGEEYARTLSDVATQADVAIAAMDDLDKAQLTGITSAVAELLDWIGRLPGAVAAAKAEISGEALMDTGTPLSSGDPDLLPPSPGQIEVSPRPQRPGVDSYGNWVDANNPPAKGGGGRGGGGKGNRGSGMLTGLMTPLEEVEAWHQEAMEFLNSASEEQLALVGGKHEALERLEAEHQHRISEINRQGSAHVTDAQRAMYGELSGLLGMFAGKSKAAAIASIAVNTALTLAQTAQHIAGAQARALFELGPITGPPAAAKIAAFGKLQMGLIAAAGIAQGLGGGGGGGGGSIAGGAGGGSASESTKTTESATPLRATIAPLDPEALFTGAAVRTLLDGLMEEAGNRGLILGWSK